MNITIFGATGRTGLSLVRQALGRGYTVTAYVRNSSKLKHFHDRNLTIVEGRLSDAEHVRLAIAAKDAVISALGVSKTLHHDPEVIDGISTIVKAMKRENVSRLIYLSVFLADSTSGQFSFFANNILKRIIRNEVEDHEIKERLVREHLEEHVIVRAVRLTDNPIALKYRHGENIVIKNFLPSISRADVAHFMLEQLTNPMYVKKSVLLTGD